MVQPLKSSSSPRTRRDETYRQVLALITGGSLAEGDRLPSETELAARFAVSRPTIRDALTRLRDAGVITVRQGAGSFVQRAGSAKSREPTFGAVRSLAEVRHCLEFRAALEGEAAALAAARADPESIEAARAALKTMASAVARESKGESADFQFQADFDFHMAIARASGNPFFGRVILDLRPSIAFTIGLSRSLSLTHSVARSRVAQAEHVAILREIEDGRPEEARQAMRTHLFNACRRVFEGWSDPAEETGRDDVA